MSVVTLMNAAPYQVCVKMAAVSIHLEGTDVTASQDMSRHRIGSTALVNVSQQLVQTTHILNLRKKLRCYVCSMMFYFK